MIRCRVEGDSVLVPVWAQAGGSRDKVGGEYAGALKVAVAQAPERGRANDAIAATLAKALGVRTSAVELVSGRTSRNKVFRVTGTTPAAVNRLA